MTQRPFRASALALGVAALLLSGAGPRATDGDPDYPHGKFEGDCTGCHDTEAWIPPAIEPGFRRSHPFPLRGAHDLPDCRTCHRNLDFTLADPACVTCHMDPHRGELGIDCGRCHVARTFVDRSRMQQDHQATRFPLRASHRALDCEDCHRLEPAGALRWVNTPVECVACHRDAYLATQDPDHLASGFPTECDLCHVPTVWEDGRFNHALAADACVTCHLDDYQSTVDPDHQAAGFPTDCEQCHTPTRWEDGRFDHDGAFFPIYSGRHANRWTSCSTCHVNSGNFGQFTCFGCHPHSDPDRTTSDHSGVDGFVYNPNDSSNCYGCHPRGEAG